MKDARNPLGRGRRGGHEQPPAFDIVTPTPDQERLEGIAKRQRRYFRIMVPCITLVAFGFFIPAPTPIRLIALTIAAVMPPIAAIVGNAPPGVKPRRRSP
jgi:DUF3099 family protein